jgi:hypothetical protein
MIRLAVLLVVLGCTNNSTSSSGTTTRPETTNPETKPPEGSGELPPKETPPEDPPVAAGPKLHEKCGPGDACGEGACVSYYGIAGPRGPQFKTCEIKCDKTTKCPSGTSCGVIADGPGQVCR